MHTLKQSNQLRLRVDGDYDENCAVDKKPMRVGWIFL